MAVDYDHEDTVVAALQGQQFLIITLAPMAPPDTQSKILKAAAKAGVPYVLPNAFGSDITNVQQGKDIMMGPAAQAARDEIESLGMQWITVACGFWYDYSLAEGELRFGFDLGNRSITFFDDGTQKISVSTLAQVGRAIAKVLSLNVLPSDQHGSSGLTLSSFFGKAVYVQSFLLSQKDIYESVKRVTGTTDADWAITYQPSKERYQEGLASLQKGDMSGFAKLLYSRGFFKDDPAEFSDKVQNKLLGLPEENLDEATQAGIDITQAR